jgi:sulfatase modifying factor 1
MKRRALGATSALLLLSALMALSIVIDLRRPAWMADLYAAGEAALAKQHWEEAITNFEALARLDPTYRDASEKLDETRYLAGSADLKAGRFDLAIARLQQILSVYDDADDKLAQALDGSVVQVPAGKFLRGSNAEDLDERPQHQLYLDAFEIDKYEVTNVQYHRFLELSRRNAPQLWPGRYVHLAPERNPNWHDGIYPPGEATYPAAGITWQNAADYCAWVGKRLPSEAEWEKAARATDGRTYPWGDAWDASNANTSETGLRYPQPVGSYPSGASPYGALDMAGNVWEWVADLYDREYYSHAPERNPQGPPSGTGERILRGGAWDSSPAQARASYRNATHFFGPNFRVGFRCARSIV